MNEKKPDSLHNSSQGVQQFIEKLRVDGVNKGQQQAEQIVLDAEKRANWIMEQARQQSEEIKNHAREQAERYRTAAEGALQMAARDALLQVKENLVNQFAAELARLISNLMLDQEFLKQLILEVAGKSRDYSGMDHVGQVKLFLPAHVTGLEELRHNPEELHEGPLSQFVLQMAGDMLREGVELKTDGKHGAGIHVQLVDANIDLDLSDEAVASLLMVHLAPRFRALLEGIVH